MRQSHLIILNAAIMWGTRILLLFPQLIMVPFLIHTIGDAGYGVYTLIWSLLMGIDRLQKSLQSGVVKYSAAFLAENQVDKVNKVVSTSFVYSIILAIVASAGISTAAIFTGDQTSDLSFSLFVIGILVLFVVPVTPFVAVIQARQRYYIGAIAETLTRYMSLGVVVVWFSLVSPSVKSLIIITSGMWFLASLAQIPIAYHLAPGLQRRINLFDSRMFRLIVSFGGVIVFAALCGIANETGIRWLMGILVSPGFVAHLAIMLMPSLLLSQVIYAVTMTIMAATSAYEATGNYHMLQELLFRTIRYTSMIGLAGVMAAAILLRDVLILWIGPDYMFLAPYTLTIFAGTAFAMTTSSAHHMLKGLGKLRITLLNSLVGQVIVPFTIIIIVLLIWNDPYIAVVVGLVVGNVIWGAMQQGFAIKAVHANLRERFAHAYGQPLTVAAAVFVPAFSLITFGGVESFVVRLSIVSLMEVLYFGGMYVIYSTVSERQQVKELSRLGINRFLAMSQRVLGNTRV